MGPTDESEGVFLFHPLYRFAIRWHLSSVSWDRAVAAGQEAWRVTLEWIAHQRPQLGLPASRRMTVANVCCASVRTPRWPSLTSHRTVVVCTA